MDTRDKMAILGQSARYDLCCVTCSSSGGRKRDDALGRWIYPAALPDGRRAMILKVLLSNVCENNCFYCAVRAGRDMPRLSFQPEELARAFDQMWRRRLVEGLFLSSGLCGDAGRTMERMIATVELVRRKYHFPGYVHLKILPGVSFGHVERAVQLAQRVSINLETPSSQRLARIAPRKARGGDLVEPMRWVQRLVGNSGGRLLPSGQTTQFVVGAAGEPDREILHTTQRLYRELDLRRAYFSAFQPIAGTPLEDRAPTPPLREHRLYQSDYLVRQYGFTFDELIFDAEGNLPVEADPKTVWARAHPERFPIEINRASREELLRVPGIGPRSAERIVRLRRRGAFRELADLKKMGAVAARAAPFILLNGRRPAYQLGLWDTR